MGAAEAMQYASMAIDMLNDIMGSVWTGLEYGLSKDASKRQEDLTYRPYSIAMADLKSAGINPILALGKGIGGAGMAPSYKMGRKPPSDLSRNVQTALQRKIDMKRLHNETEQIQNQEELMDSQTKLNQMKTAAERQLGLMYANSSAKIKSDKLLSDAMATKTIADTKVSTAMESKVTKEALRILLENQKSESQKYLYKGKKGKFFGFLDWMRKFIPFTASKKF